MLREINQQELSIILANIQMLMYIKKNEDKIHEIFPTGETDIHEYNLTDALYDDYHNKVPFFNHILRCNCEIIEPMYSEDFFETKSDKYNDYVDKYPKYGSHYSYNLDFESFENGEAYDSGYMPSEVVLYSETLNKFFDLYIDNEEKMRVVNETLCKLKNIFCAKLGDDFVCPAFAVINTEEYSHTDYIALEYLKTSKYVICFCLFKDNDRIPEIDDYIYYLKEMQYMFDYIEAEVNKVERVCN